MGTGVGFPAVQMNWFRSVTCAGVGTILRYHVCFQIWSFGLVGSCSIPT